MTMTMTNFGQVLIYIYHLQLKSLLLLLAKTLSLRTFSFERSRRSNLPFGGILYRHVCTVMLALGCPLPERKRTLQQHV
jgi:hypothetical protein